MVSVNYCQHWFDHIPSAPYTLLSMIDIILLKLEPDLFNHLATRGVRAKDWAWKWMSNGFQTVYYSQTFILKFVSIFIKSCYIYIF